MDHATGLQQWHRPSERRGTCSCAAMQWQVAKAHPPAFCSMYACGSKTSDSALQQLTQRKIEDKRQSDAHAVCLSTHNACMHHQVRR